LIDQSREISLPPRGGRRVGEVDVWQVALVGQIGHQVVQPLGILRHPALDPGRDPEEQLDVPAAQPLDHAWRIGQP